MFVDNRILGDLWQATKGLQLTLLSDAPGYIVTGIGTATDTDITIPVTGYNDNLPVVAIKEKAFENCDSLTNIVIPRGVGIPNLHPHKNNGVF